MLNSHLFFRCIMDNQAAMFTAQQMQYNKMYGMDPGRRMDELAAAQSQLRPGYGQHPWVNILFFSIDFFVFSLFLVILCGRPSHSFATPTTVRNCFEILLFPVVASQTGPGQDKSRNCSIFTIFSPSFPSIHPRVWPPAAAGLNVKYSGLLRAPVPIIFIINNKWNYFHRKENNLSLKARIKAN